MLNLEAIERAIASIESVSRAETSIEVGDIKVYLRPLSGKEEVDVVEYAMVAMAEGERANRAHLVDFYYRSQVRTLAHAITRVGSLNLQADSIETGEVVEGVQVRRPKVEVLVEFIEKHWSKVVVQKMFVCAVNALEAATNKTIDQIRSNPFNYDAEIERLKARIKELETTRDQISHSSQSENWASAMKASSLAYAQAAEDEGEAAPEEEVDMPEVPQAPERKPSYPPGAHQAPVMRPQAAAPVVEDPAEHSSFLDEGNPEASIAAETRRQAEIQRRGRLDSLRQARNTQEVILDSRGSSIDVKTAKTGWGSTQEGAVMSTDGPMEVSDRTVSPSGPPPAFNTPPKSAPSPKNPRFRR